MGQVGDQLQIKDLMLAELSQVSHTADPGTVGIGNIVETNVGSFCICVGAGKIEGLDAMAISRNAPMAIGLLGKSVGEFTRVNGKEIIINNVK